MSLRPLPAIEAPVPSQIHAFAPDENLFDRWSPEIRAAQAASRTIDIMDVIGADWYGDGITGRSVKAALEEMGPGEVHVDINSPGGDYFEGIAIYNLLREHEGKVTVRILGLAASAASVVAMAGDEVRIGATASLMIHNAWGVVIGNRNDLIAAAKTLEGFDEVMAGLYAEISDYDVEQIAQMMDNETWFSGREAVEHKFADALLEDDQTTRDEGSGTPQVLAIRKVEATMMRAGMPRSERRSLLGEIKGGKPATVTQDADATLIGDMQSLIASLKRKD